MSLAWPTLPTWQSQPAYSIPNTAPYTAGGVLVDTNAGNFVPWKTDTAAAPTDSYSKYLLNPGGYETSSYPYLVTRDQGTKTPSASCSQVPFQSGQTVLTRPVQTATSATTRKQRKDIQYAPTASQHASTSSSMVTNPPFPTQASRAAPTPLGSSSSPTSRKAKTYTRGTQSESYGTKSGQSWWQSPSSLWVGAAAYVSSQALSLVSRVHSSAWQIVKTIQSVSDTLQGGDRMLAENEKRAIVAAGVGAVGLGIYALSHRGGTDDEEDYRSSGGS